MNRNRIASTRVGRSVMLRTLLGALSAGLLTASASTALDRAAAPFAPEIVGASLRALEELAQAQSLLLAGGEGRHDEAIERLDRALAHLKQARARLPRRVEHLRTRRGRELPILLEPASITLPLERIPAETLRILRPFRRPTDRALRVDLDQLTRRLQRARHGEAQALLGELFLATGSALTLGSSAADRIAAGAYPQKS